MRLHQDTLQYCCSVWPSKTQKNWTFGANYYNSSTTALGKIWGPLKRSTFKQATHLSHCKKVLQNKKNIEKSLLSAWVRHVFSIICPHIERRQRHVCAFYLYIQSGFYCVLLLWKWVNKVERPWFWLAFESNSTRSSEAFVFKPSTSFLKTFSNLFPTYSCFYCISYFLFQDTRQLLRKSLCLTIRTFEEILKLKKCWKM